MKYYSELLDKLFDDDEQLIKEENRYYELTHPDVDTETSVSMSAEETSDKKLISKEKKELSQKIEEADTALDLAYENYEKAKAKVVELKKETDQKCQDIIKEAKKQLRAAQDSKYARVASFNDKFGPYSVSYTGDKALKEMNRHLSWFDDLLNSFWF